MTHDDGQIRTYRQHGSLGMTECELHAPQILLCDAVNPRLHIGDRHARSHQRVDQHLGWVEGVHYTEADEGVRLLGTSHGIAGGAHLAVHSQHRGDIRRPR